MDWRGRRKGRRSREMERWDGDTTRLCVFAVVCSLVWLRHQLLEQSWGERQTPPPTHIIESAVNCVTVFNVSRTSSITECSNELSAQL